MKYGVYIGKAWPDLHGKHLKIIGPKNSDGYDGYNIQFLDSKETRWVFRESVRLTNLDHEEWMDMLRGKPDVSI